MNSRSNLAPPELRQGKLDLNVFDSDPRNPKVDGPRATPAIVMDAMGW